MTTEPQRAGPSFTARVASFFDEHHARLQRTHHARRYLYQRLTRALQVRIPKGQRVLEVGCGSGDLLAALEPSHGVGIDLSARAVGAARERYPRKELRFISGDATDPRVLADAAGPFDVVLLVNVITQVEDVQALFEALQSVCHRRTRVLVYSYSRLWQPILTLAEWLGFKLRLPQESWLPPEEVSHMLMLADYDLVRRDAHVVLPIGIPLVSNFVNRVLGHLPGCEWASLIYGIVARPAPARFASSVSQAPSVSVVIPCRNEAGHIDPLVSRLPLLPVGSEFLFVEGGSKDDTEARIRAAIEQHPQLPLRLLKQTGKGKGDAVRLGFAESRGDVLLILDSDMGVAPEDIPKFVAALARGKAEFVNGSRLVYPMDGRAMRFLNLVANKGFALLFGWLLGQQVRDTLCGTKVLYREDYERIAQNRAYFGDFDPFGDFDLLFGAARLNLKIVDLAVRYHERTYGETNISRFRHGVLLLRMSLFAARKLKFV